MKFVLNLKLFFLFIFFILLISLVNANTDYNITGNPNGYFQLGIGLWNEKTGTDYDTFNRIIANPLFLPLINDLDGDGGNEIIVIDGQNIRLYENKELDIVDSFIVSSDILSNVMTYDIDGDNYTEIIFVTDDQYLHIIEYNGTSITNSSYNITSISHIDGEFLINCRDIEDCFMVYVREMITTGEERISGVFFNSTHIGTQTIMSTDSGGGRDAYCFPQIPIMQIKDYDGDNDEEYIFSFMHLDISAPEEDEDILIFYIEVSGTIVTLEQNVTITDTPDFSDLNIGGCDIRNYGKHFTNPFVFDIDQSTSNGLETVVGYMVNDDEFEMRSFGSNGEPTNRFPEILNSEGEIVSNIFLANAMTDTGKIDFCVMGYQQSINEIHLLCGSPLSSFFETEDFEFEIDNLYNISFGFQNYHSITHATEQRSFLVDGNDLDEVINSYGVFEIDYEGDNELLLRFENPIEDCSLLSLDIEKIGREDLLCLSDTNLWYIDDRFTNDNAEIQRFTTNPSILVTIKENTTVHVDIFPFDEDGDDMQVNMISYDGHINRQSTGWSTFVSTGGSVPFTFEANQTIAIGVLNFAARDTEHNESNNITFPFSVSTEGHEFGDSFFDSGDLIELVEEIIPDNFTAEDNALRDLIRALGEDTGVPPTIILFVLIIAFLISGLVVGSKTNDLKLGVGIGIGLDIMTIITFAYFRLIDTAVVVVTLFLFVIGTIMFLVIKHKESGVG